MASYISKSINAQLTTNLADIYTCGQDIEAKICFLLVSNIHQTTPGKVTVKYYNALSSTSRHLIFESTILLETSLNIVGRQTGVLVLNVGDKIQAKCSTDNTQELILSVTERSLIQ